MKQTTVFLVALLACWAQASVLDLREVADESSACSENSFYCLPEGFIFGTGSSNYQVEGAWQEDGKGVSQIDHHLHIIGGPNGDVADDSYHKYKDDVQVLKELKVNAYRFSLSWSRLLPTGGSDNVNQAGVTYYKNLIDELIENNITPIVTLYHLEHPQVLEDQFKGWLSPDMIKYFEDYARFAFKTFGDKVKWWTTVNEPYVYATLVYGYGMFAPATLSPGANEYLAVHHMVLAHARAYRLYHSEFAHQQGSVGISLQSYFARPKTRSFEDIQAAERRNVFEVAWVADALLRGDYPDLMRRIVDSKSRAEGLKESRLPTFSDAEKQLINGTLDFLGLNAYFGVDATDGCPPTAGNPSLDRDSGVLAAYPGDPTDMPVCTFSHDTPWSIRESLLWLKNRYGSIKVLITENGLGSPKESGLDDQHRQVFLSGYLRQMLRAMNDDNCNVIGYIAWSFMDSFEWTTYEKKFGLVHVDQDSPNKARTLKKSGELVRKIMTERLVPEITASGAASRVELPVTLLVALGLYLSAILWSPQASI